VVVNDLDDNDGRDSRPIEPTVVSKRQRWRRLENEPSRMIKIDCELPVTIALEFMTARCGQLPNIGEALRGTHFIQSPSDDFGRTLAKYLLTQPCVVAGTLEFLCSKSNVQPSTT